MNRYILSVVVPAYNAEKYIGKCLNSLLNQSDLSLEIIVVNDGSTDNTEKTVEEMARANANIVLVNQENQGLFRSRINGMKYVHADYVTFCDSDDYIDPGFYSEMMKIIRDTDIDVLQFGYRRIAGNKIVKEYSVGNFSCTGIEAIKKMFETHMLSNNNTNKIYKSNLFKNELFLEKVKYYDEDKLINTKVLRKALHVEAVPYIGYNYTLNENGIVETINKRKGIEILKTDTYIYEFVKKYIPELTKSSAYDFCARLAECYYRCIVSERLFEQKNEILRQFRRIYKENGLFLYKPKHASMARFLSINMLYVNPTLFEMLRNWRDANEGRM